MTAAIMHTSTRTIRRRIAAGLLRAGRPGGGRLLVDRDSVRQLIEGAAGPS